LRQKGLTDTDDSPGQLTVYTSGDRDPLGRVLPRLGIIADKIASVSWSDGIAPGSCAPAGHSVTAFPTAFRLEVE
jgi:hypothetical protein